MKKTKQTLRNELEKSGIDAISVLNCFQKPFFFFDRAGQITPVHHKQVPELLETNDISGKHLLDVLNVDKEDRVNFENWIKLLFSKKLSFEEAALLGPENFKHKKTNRVISFEYRPVKDEKKHMISVLVFAVDQTGAIQKQVENVERDRRSKFLLKAFSFKSQFVDCMSELKTVTKRLRTFANVPSADKLLEVKRMLHTLTGASSYFHLIKIAAICRETEIELKNVNPENKNDLAKIFLSACLKLNEQYQNLFREYSPVLGLPAFNNEISREIPLQKLEKFQKLIYASDPDLGRKFLDEFVKIPISRLFAHFEGAVQDAAVVLGKKVLPLEIKGDHVLIFEAPYKNLFASFYHIFNNLIDHGIEDPYVREKLGKPAEGLISVEIINDRDEFIEIIISDDGKGIDTDLIKRKLEVNEINYSYLTEEEVLQTIFLPDFSTKEDVGRYSGRGIGLNAVADELEQIGGKITVYSRFGLGVTFHMKIPLVISDTDVT